MNKIVVVGTSHHVAPIEFRERFAFRGSKLVATLQSLKNHRQISEVLILSTCNRVEIYAAIDQSADPSVLSNYLADSHQIDREIFAKNSYTCENRNVMRHLFRVASSLDSIVIGESQIVGQIKGAYENALTFETTGQLLNRLFTKAISVGKKIRSETSIAERPISISYAAVLLAKQILTDLSDKNVVIIGAGKMGELTVKHLVDHGVSNVTVVNRSCDRAKRVAEMFNGKAIVFQPDLGFLIDTDIVITSTSAPYYLIQTDPFSEVMIARKNRPIVMIDIAVPRDIDPKIAKIENVFLYNIDHLQNIVSENLETRKRHAEIGEKIVDREAKKFDIYLRTLAVDPTIKALHQHFDEIIERELATCKAHLTADQERSVRLMMKSVAKRILHQPTLHLRQQIAAENDPRDLAVFRKAFDLEKLINEN